MFLGKKYKKVLALLFAIAIHINPQIIGVHHF